MLRGWTVIAFSIGAALLVLGWVAGLQYRLQGTMLDLTAMRRTTLGIIIVGLLAIALILNRRLHND
jgi:hypothetical protein